MFTVVSITVSKINSPKNYTTMVPNIHGYGSQRFTSCHLVNVTLLSLVAAV